MASRLLKATARNQPRRNAVKPIKFVLLAVGVLCAIAVFLPFVSIEGQSISLWTLKAVKAGPTWIALLGSLGLAGLAGMSVAKGQLGRGAAAGGLVLGAIVALITILQFDARAPFGKFAGLGAQILLFGGAFAAIASIVALVKPDRAA
jgi:hypothetical protein